MIDNNIRGYTVMISVSSFSHHSLSFLCKTAYSNKRPERSHGIKGKMFVPTEITLNENEAVILFSYLLIIASLFIVCSRKYGDQLQ